MSPDDQTLFWVLIGGSLVIVFIEEVRAINRRRIK